MVLLGLIVLVIIILKVAYEYSESKAEIKFETETAAAGSVEYIPEERGLQILPEDLLALFKETIPFIKMHHKKGSLAPIAAAVNSTGEVVARALVGNSPGSVSVKDALRYYKKVFRDDAKDGKIIAAIIYYHSHLSDDNTAIVALIENALRSYAFIIPYCSNQEKTEYYPPVIEENKQEIFSKEFVDLDLYEIPDLDDEILDAFVSLRPTLK